MLAASVPKICGGGGVCSLGKIIVGKDFPKLKTIKLSYSHNLIETPDFTKVPNLEMLDLKGCTRLCKVHESVGVLKSLIVLNLEGCSSLQSFPSNLFALKSLKNLNLQGCSKLDKLPKNLEVLEHLEELDVGGIAITQVPSSIARSDDNSVKIGLPPNWLNDEFMGIAMCGVLTLDLKDFNGREIGAGCHMNIIGNHYIILFPLHSFTTFESDHLWLAYLPHEQFEHDRSLTSESRWKYDGCGYDSINSVLVSTSTRIHACFEVSRYPDGGALNSKVIKSGIRLVYKRDIECSEDGLPATDAFILHQHQNCSTFAGEGL
ncbi:hypothetical protein LWI29_020236 [Acer saccharum]|uniref:C-JID domain-containing protein n=1 Tax=Acer saccharum TaxID=4024 RepID=A0AA39VV17_ACESA|nr:hypothetical protein LWI29_020236 [Acer saccharum]